MTTVEGVTPSRYEELDFTAQRGKSLLEGSLTTHPGEKRWQTSSSAAIGN